MSAFLSPHPSPTCVEGGEVLLTWPCHAAPLGGEVAPLRVGVGCRSCEGHVISLCPTYHRLILHICF